MTVYKDPKLISKAVDYYYNNPNKPLREIAERYQCSVSQLSKWISRRQKIRFGRV